MFRARVTSLPRLLRNCICNVRAGPVRYPYWPAAYGFAIWLIVHLFLFLLGIKRHASQGRGQARRGGSKCFYDPTDAGSVGHFYCTLRTIPTVLTTYVTLETSEILQREGLVEKIPHLSATPCLTGISRIVRTHTHGKSDALPVET